MAVKTSDVAHRTYYIPDNFIAEGRIFHGQIRIRFLVEGVILALIMLIPALLIPADWKARIYLVMLFCAPPLILGTVGINGDSVSRALLNAVRWRRQFHTMLYNPGTMTLEQHPVIAAETDFGITDRLSEILVQHQDRRRERLNSTDLREGETMEFAEDVTLQNLAFRGEADTVQSPKEPRRKRKKGSPVNIELEFKDNILTDDTEISIPSGSQGAEINVNTDTDAYRTPQKRRRGRKGRTADNQPKTPPAGQEMPFMDIIIEDEIPIEIPDAGTGLDIPDTYEDFAPTWDFDLDTTVQIEK